MTNTAERYTGTVSAWYPQRAFGFIDGDVFFHLNDLRNFSKPLEGDRVSFALTADRKQHGRKRATDVKLVT
jgi:cold shock CspA family protein